MTSPAEVEAWFMHRLFPESPAHQLFRVYRITGELRVEALRAAWRAVVGEHAALRTTFAEADGVPLRRVARQGPPMAFSDLTGADPEQLDRLLAIEAMTPADPADGPPARAILLRVGEAEHVLLLTLHRAIADEHSMSLLAEGLSTAYAAEGTAYEGPRPPAPSLPGVAPPAPETTAGTALDWWTRQLTPFPPRLELPTDRPEPAEPACGGGTVRFDWGDDVRAGLRALAGTAGTEPWVVVLAALQGLLRRYGGEDQVAVGVLASTRPASGEGGIGAFRNLLVLGADVPAGLSFREVVSGASRLVGGAFARRWLPITELTRGLDTGRHVPLCQVVLVPAAPEAELRLAGATARRHHLREGATWADLTLTVGPCGASGSLTYRAALFDRSTAGAVLDHLRTLLSAALADPGLPLDALPVEDEATVAAGVAAADAIAAPAVLPVHQLVRRQAERHPDAVAVSWEGGTITYRDLIARAHAAISGPTPVPRGGAVAVRLAPGPGPYVALLAMLAAGAHVVWFGTTDAGDRGKAVLDDLRPAFLLLDHDADGDELAAWYRDEAGGRLVALPALDGAPEPGAPWAGEPGDRAYVAYTSGSTGRPKGISQTHGALAQFVTWMAEEFRMGPGARVAQWVAPEHDPALCEVFATLVGGGTLCPIPPAIRLNPDKLVDWLIDERITHIQLIPSFARELLYVIEDRGLAGRLDSLGHLLLMGEALPAELANELRARLPHTRLLNLYGPTETIAATWHEIDGPARGPVPIGRPIPGRQVLVVDERDRPCPAGVTGEIVIRSPYVTPGYLGREGDHPAFAPLRGFGPQGCYRSGDLGRRRWDGLLEFRGRKDFQVKLLGNRFELSDVEAALNAHESVAESAAVAVANHEGLVTRLAIFVVPREGGAPDVWRAHLRRRFGKLNVPATFTVMSDRLPRNLAGKIDRRRLPRPAEPSRPRAARPPRTPVERRLAEIWSELLGIEVEDVRAEDTFFAAGGHSLLLPLLAGRIGERLGVRLPLRACFANPSLAALAALVESMDSAATSDAMPTNP
ncbi:amino acid adenylation domain-containing protein [Nonomuraea jiangxiensis]|uniref:Amino acid adenylation domain-containing protein n=2 Tax=Nonomuraea jiangxiensis TaxID=633440 RepID=A0A1G8IJG3_9ACTN|nr:amino acid adenylation domain-containing protein [Nonomuraea jiangxiensis]